MPTSFQVRASLVEAPFLSASTNDRCGFRVDRLFTSPPFRFLHATSAVLRWHGATFRLRSQTIFTLPFPLYPRHLRLRLPCRVRSHSSVPRNLRLLFRPGRTGIFSPASNRRTAAIRHHPPTHKRTDERTEISPLHSLHFSPCRAVGICHRGPNVGGFHYRPHPERGFFNGI